MRVSYQNASRSRYLPVTITSLSRRLRPLIDDIALVVTDLALRTGRNDQLRLVVYPFFCFVITYMSALHDVANHTDPYLTNRNHPQPV